MVAPWACAFTIFSRFYTLCARRRKTRDPLDHAEAYGMRYIGILGQCAVRAPRQNAHM